MELGRPQHLLQPRPLGRLAWRLSSAAALVSPASHRLGQSSRLRRQLGISATQLQAAKPHSPTRLHSAWYQSACLSSSQPPRSKTRQSSRHPTRAARQWRSAAHPLSPAKPSRRQSTFKATTKPASAAKPACTSFRRSFRRKSPAAVSVEAPSIGFLPGSFGFLRGVAPLLPACKCNPCNSLAGATAAKILQGKELLPKYWPQTT
jgi:hypothetical protein